MQCQGLRHQPDPQLPRWRLWTAVALGDSKRKARLSVASCVSCTTLLQAAGESGERAIMSTIIS
jgi:hypothetical protein